MFPRRIVETHADTGEARLRLLHFRNESIQEETKFMEREYYAMFDDERRGPFTLEQLLAAGVRSDTLVWYEGSRRWLPASEVPELAENLHDAPVSTVRVDEDGILAYPESFLQTPYKFGVYGWFIAIGWTVYFAYQGTTLDRASGSIGMVGGAILWFIAVGCLLMFWYRTLVIVQDGFAWLAPGAAVGYLFIPFFNLYWIFRATVGSVRELNRYAERRGLAAPRPSMFFAVAFATYFLLSVVPIVGAACALVNLVLFPLFLTSLKATAVCFCAGRR